MKQYSSTWKTGKRISHINLFLTCHKNSNNNIAFQNLSIYYAWNNIRNHVYINRINNRLVFKIKDKYKVELQWPKTMKLFGSVKKLIDKTKNGEKVTSLEVVEVVLVQSDLVDNQYQKNLKYYTLLHPIYVLLIS